MKNNKGFTLLEIIVVITIISALAAFLAPQYIQYIERSRESNDLQLAQTIVDATAIAISDPESSIPGGYFLEVHWATGPETASGYENNILIRYPSSAGRTSIYNDSLNRVDNLQPLPNTIDIKAFSESLAITLNTQVLSINSIVGQGYAGDFKPALSEIGKSTNFVIHVDTTNGNLALASHNSSTTSVNDWLELGLRLSPAE